MSKEDIQKVMKTIPLLTDFGIGISLDSRGLTATEGNAEFQRNRQALLDSVESFEKTLSWLQGIDKIKSFNNRRSSYGLKHVAERSIGYVTNGVFIAAAVHAGFKYKITKGDPNVVFNMSEKSIKYYEKA